MLEHTSQEKETDAQSRDRTIWNAIAKCASGLLSRTDCETAFPAVLQLLGTVMDASRVCLLELQRTSDGRLVVTKRCNWAADSHEDAGLARARREEAWLAAVDVDCVSHDSTKNRGLDAKRIVDPQGFLKALIVPILVRNELWGKLVFDDCKVGATSVGDETLRTLAELIAGCVSRAEQSKHLADACRVIEKGPAIVFRFAPASIPRLVHVSGNVNRLGYSAAELLASPDLWLTRVYPRDRLAMRIGIDALIQGCRQDHPLGFRWQKPDGSIAWIDGRIWSVQDTSGRITALEGVGLDVSDRKTVEKRLASLNKTDDLTWLLNRKGFVRRLNVAHADARRKGVAFAVHVLNLDNFRDVNDTLGLLIGDKLLRVVARRIGRHLSPCDVVARISADFFAILQPGISDTSEAKALADQIRQAIKQTVIVGNNRVSITASVGSAFLDRHLTKGSELLSHADLALHEAKKAGGDRCVVYSNEMNQAVHRRMTVTEELRAALKGNAQLSLYYQPQVDIVSRRIIGLEALLRWEHPEMGLLLPAEFIAIAEKSAIIGTLGDWVLNEAFRQMSEWKKKEIEPPILAINLSAAQFRLDPEFDKSIASAIRRWSLDPHKLEFEITETVLMDRTGERMSQLKKITDLGVRLSIDDFGTGYSSLDFLLAFKTNRLKIAQQFVEGLPDKADHVAITRATLSLAKEFGIEVIAEGAETAEQVEFLASAGCRFAQGYYYSRAVTAEAATKMLRLGQVEKPQNS